MIRTSLLSEIPHFLSSLVIALFLFWHYRKWYLVPLCFLTGIFIDLDHFLDFSIYAGLGSNLFKMFSIDYFQQSQKVYVLIHGWEWLILLWFLGKKIKEKGVKWALILPYFTHLLIDQFSGYTSNPLAYFLTFRLLNGFDLAKFAGL